MVPEFEFEDTFFNQSHYFVNRYAHVIQRQDIHQLCIFFCCTFINQVHNRKKAENNNPERKKKESSELLLSAYCISVATTPHSQFRMHLSNRCFFGKPLTGEAIVHVSPKEMNSKDETMWYKIKIPLQLNVRIFNVSVQLQELTFCV